MLGITVDNPTHVDSEFFREVRGCFFCELFEKRRQFSIGSGVQTITLSMQNALPQADLVRTLRWLHPGATIRISA